MTRRESQLRRKPGRRGIAVIVVLGLLAITLALSYALLRTQGTANLIARNSAKQLDARLAAEAGLAAALRKMHEEGWAGVSSQLTANVDAHSSYVVEYSTGDDSLSATSPEYAEYPFRVTITSTGKAFDPLQPTMQVTYRLQAVVQLVRRALRSSNPVGWSNYLQPTVYQWSTSDAHVNFPVRIEGASTFLGRLRLSSNYPGTVSTRDLYLTGLNELRTSTGVDSRPFGGAVTLGTSAQLSDVANSLASSLGLPLVASTSSTSAPVARPESVTSYTLYPGGKSYSIPSLTATYGSTVSNVTLAADPVSNPLGIYRGEGQVTLGNNVSLTGTLLAGDSNADVRIQGTGVKLFGRNLPALDSGNVTHQLPTVISGDDLRLIDDASASINGLAIVWDEFELADGSQQQTLNFTGRLLTAKFHARGRQEWDVEDLVWDLDKTLFQLQYRDPPEATTVTTFPEWMGRKYGFAYISPKLKLAPNTDGVQYRWQDWSQSVYVKAVGDVGLKWNVVRIAPAN